MEVTNCNFDDVLKTLPEVIKNAQFIAFDTEFTGLRLEGKSSYNYFDTLEELYNANRERVQSFMAIQYGICAFKYHTEDDRYTCRAYNFYLFPSGRKNFTCEVSSIRFLSENGFNFNKLFLNGIPYLTSDELENELDKLKCRQEKFTQAAESPSIRVPDDRKPIIADVMKKIEEFLVGDEAEIRLPRHNSFVRRLIYQSTQAKFGGLVTLQSCKDETMLVMKGLSEEERQKKMDEKWEEERSNIHKQVGFSNVIKLIIDSGKLLIGHNLLQDLLFTINQFLQPLPTNFEEFRSFVQDLFPRLIDTKHIASVVGDAKRESTLTNLLEGYEEVEIPVVVGEEEGLGYTRGQTRLHEAAYDAYLTGLSFLAIMGRVGKLNTTDIHKNLPESPLLRPMMNKLSVPRLADISYMDLEGSYSPPNRSNVFHITYPELWKRDDILNYFKDYGFINIGWINSTSAYIGVGKDFVKKLKKTLMRKKDGECLIQTYCDYKGIKNEPAVTKNTDNFLSNGRKRRSSEDVGEPVTPSMKKTCAFPVPAFE